MTSACVYIHTRHLTIRRICGHWSLDFAAYSKETLFGTSTFTFSCKIQDIDTFLLILMKTLTWTTSSGIILSLLQFISQYKAKKKIHTIWNLCQQYSLLQVLSSVLINYNDLFPHSVQASFIESKINCINQVAKNTLL